MLGDINDKDTEFGEVEVAPTQCEPDMMPSELVDVSTLTHLSDD